MVVIRDFIDRETLKGYKVGDTFTHNDPERVNILVSRGYIKADDKTTEDEPKEAKKPPKTPKTTAKAKGGTRTTRKAKP